MPDDPSLSLAPPPDEAPAPIPAESPSRMGPRGKPFQPGNRMNPGGRPRSDPALRRALDRLSHESVKVLGALLRDPKTPRETRRKVAEYVVDRRLGRATVAVANPDGSAILAPGATPEGPIAALLARLAARRGAPPAGAPAPTEPENASPGANGSEPRGSA